MTQTPPTRARLLVVEDEAITAMALRATLQDMGYDVPATAATGEDAIARAREVRPDAVLMDIRLKGEMDGIAAADAIRRELGSPVIYLTAYSDPETLRRARVTEPYGYIVKPYNEKELRAIVEIAVHKGAMERARSASREEIGQQVLQGIIDANPAPIYLTHADGRLMLVNRRFEEQYKVPRGNVASAKLPAALAEADAKALAGGVASSAQDAIRIPLQRPDGSTYGLCTILTPASSAAGATGAIGQLAQELERRVPEARRGGAADALASSHAEMSSEARALTGSLRKLLGGLLNAGPPARHGETVDLTDIARAAAWHVANAMRVSDPDVLVEDGVRVHGDRLLLKVVLENLMRHAFGFPRPGVRPAVQVGRASGRPGEVVFFVRDNGKGFDPRLAAGIFEPFARSNAPELGLALSATRNLVEGHGGRVWAESDARGATVFVSLPLA